MRASARVPKVDIGRARSIGAAQSYSSGAIHDECAQPHGARRALQDWRNKEGRGQINAALYSFTLGVGAGALKNA